MSSIYSADFHVDNQLSPLQAQVLEDIATSQPIQIILDNLCLFSEDVVKDCVASIMVMHQQDACLTVLAAPNLSKAAVEALNATVPGVGNGSCANTFANKEPTFVSDVATDFRWENARELAEALGIGACWSFPIYQKGKIFGSFAITSEKKREPDELQKQLLKISAHLAGIAIEKENTERYRRYSEIAFKNASVGVIVADEDGKVFRSNATFSHMTGIKEEQMIDADMLDLLIDDEKRLSFIKKVLSKQKIWCGEALIHSAELGKFPALVNISAVAEEDGSIVQYVAEVSDISLLKESQDKLKHMAHHDLLTNLANRFSFENYLKQSLLNEEKKAILFIDLDNFKTINDTQGHAVGDVLLRQVAGRLHGCMRDDDIVARLGGDEFVTLISYNDIIDIEKLAIRITKKIAAPYVINNREFFSSASIGIALSPDDGNDVGTLIKNADAAMYKAKKSGKNQFCFYTKELTLLLKSKMQMEAGLRTAISNDELHIVYQPKFDERQKVVGVEALLRWRNQKHGSVSPVDFIPVAEESGMIIELGRWVLSNACKQVKQWHDEGVLLPLSINVSRYQLIDSFEVELSGVLIETGFDPNFLELEITESTILEQIEENKNLLNRIHALGVKISIDDFGTGYSSLSELKNLPVQTLKIDRSLVCDLPDDKDDEAIARAVIAMGHALDLSVIAEGVEAQSQLDVLKDAGCDYFQGYLLGKPLSHDVFLSKFFNSIEPFNSYH